MPELNLNLFALQDLCGVLGTGDLCLQLIANLTLLTLFLLLPPFIDLALSHNF